MRPHPRHRDRVELLENVAKASRATVDDQARVEPYLPLWNEIAELGYFVLGACRHPELRDSTALFGSAKAALDPELDTCLLYTSDAADE